MDALQETIKRLQESFVKNEMEFDGEPENFWKMINDADIQNAIVETMRKKIEYQKTQRAILSGWTGGRRLHC